MRSVSHTLRCYMQYIVAGFLMFPSLVFYSTIGSTFKVEKISSMWLVDIGTPFAQHVEQS